MKVTDCALSLFLLLGSSAHLANAFQVSPKQKSGFLRVESSSSSSSHPQSISVLQSSKIARWNAVNKFSVLRMSAEEDAEADVETESESESPEAPEAEAAVAEASEDESAKDNVENIAFFASKPEPTKVDDTTSETVASDEVSEEEEEAAPVTAESATEEEPSGEKAEYEESSSSEMSVNDILAVAEEMKERTQSMPDPPVVEEKEPLISLEAIKSASRKGIEFINSPPPPPAPKTKDDEKIDAFVQALGEAAKGTSKEIAKGILGSLRMAAANALTKSLPDEERSKILERIKVSDSAEDLPEQEEEEEEEVDDEEEIRASIAEEIAAARAEEARRSEELWEAEKESLIKQMEEAANARVENELAIQKERLVDEMKAMEVSMVESKQQLEAEKAKLEEQLVDMDKRVEEIKIGSSEVDELQNIIEKREKQKADLGKVEDDLRVRLQEIEQQKQLIAERTEELQTAEAEAAAKAEEAASEEQVTNEAESTVDTPAEPVSVHPVLGEMVSDLGYKRIYLTSAETLGTLPIWKKQRIFRQSRARTMALEKAKNMENGFPGAICLAEDSEGNLSVLDGQHRIGMMQLLRDMQDKEDVAFSSEAKEYFDKVLVEVYPNVNAGSVDDDKHAESVFLEINKAEPVKLVDMPGIASARDNKIITQAVQRLEEQFPQMFSASQKCRVPNVNVDNLRNNIFGANIMKRHRLRSGKQLFDWLLVQNAAVGASYELDVGRREAISESAWEKASENAFYLGLESSWLYM